MERARRPGWPPGSGWFFSGGTSGSNGGTLRDSFKNNMTISDFTVPRLQRERMNPTDTLAVPENVAVLFHLKEERPAFRRLIVAIADSFNEEYTSLAVEFDLSSDQIRSGNS